MIYYANLCGGFLVKVLSCYEGHRNKGCLSGSKRLSATTLYILVQLLSTERSHDLIEAFSYSEKFDNIDNDKDTRETDWPDHLRKSL